ncbi:unnamed protein product [Vitrella brassicaformis CCMP3155]|uniref:CCAAT-binding factor domain-containing protein n=2 Tax=Vitrella brassicaformis TaxID=1169539 RepID=A0A0G4GV71_VITBC|nr:unnamed protein product [Vitrella brassicaformis CCMP3155]|eukprot:CEM34771.1 unnamed protein product [Vitrella brassicaformis CCMP3155]
MDPGEGWEGRMDGCKELDEALVARTEEKALKNPTGLAQIGHIFDDCQEVGTVEEVASCLQSLQRIFYHYKRQHRLPAFLNAKRRKRQWDAEGDGEGEDDGATGATDGLSTADERLRKWLELNFDNYVKLVLSFISCQPRGKQTRSKLQVCAVRHYLHSLQQEALLWQQHEDFTFPTRFLQTLVHEVVHAPTYTTALHTTLMAEYLTPYADLSYYFLLVLKRVINHTHQQLKQAEAGSKEEEMNGDVPPSKADSNGKGEPTYPGVFYLGALMGVREPESGAESSAAATDGPHLSHELQTVSKRCLQMLKSVPRPEKAPRGSKRRSKSADGQEEERPEGLFVANVLTTKCKSPHSYRLAYQSAWLAYLSLPLVPSTAQSLLSHLSVGVMPYISNPLTLADFLLKAFDKGSYETSITALSGLFYLLTKYKLGDPEVVAKSVSRFYHRLYDLIRPAIFAVPNRKTFLQLVNLSLRSTMVPSAMLAAFCKRLMRVACLSPPHGAVWCVAMTYALIMRNKAVCMPLIHVDRPEWTDPTVPEMEPIEGGDPFFRVKGDLDALCEIVKQHEGAEGEGEDGEGEGEGGKQQQAVNRFKGFSLWEIKLLRKHWHPAVADLAQLFEADMTKWDAKQVDPDDFADLTPATLRKESLKVLKKPQLYSPTPNPSDPLADELFDISMDLEAFLRGEAPSFIVSQP